MICLGGMVVDGGFVYRILKREDVHIVVFVNKHQFSKILIRLHVTKTSSGEQLIIKRQLCACGVG